MRAREREGKTSAKKGNRGERDRRKARIRAFSSLCRTTLEAGFRAHSSAVMSCQSCLGSPCCLILTVLFWLSCPGFPVSAVLSRLSRSSEELCANRRKVSTNRKRAITFSCLQKSFVNSKAYGAKQL
jgi:hypothetical protein